MVVTGTSMGTVEVVRSGWTWVYFEVVPKRVAAG
jgi:hypothetical protein